MTGRRTNILIVMLLWTMGSWGVPFAWSHCDTLDGPVVADARRALEQNNVTPALKWVKEEYERPVREAFQKAIKSRAKEEVREEADREFFETLVRLHRSGEGVSYSGLKPAGTIEPLILEADKAIEAGTDDELLQSVTSEISEGIQKRFHRVLEKKEKADEDAVAGREYVNAYVALIRYVEELEKAAQKFDGGAESTLHDHDGE